MKVYEKVLDGRVSKYVGSLWRAHKVDTRKGVVFKTPFYDETINAYNLRAECRAAYRVLIDLEKIF